MQAVSAASVDYHSVFQGRIGVLPFILLLLAMAGCQPDSSSSEKMALPAVPVTVSQPLLRKVQDFEEYTGRVQAKETIEIRARVTGYLQEIRFKEGEEVKEGDPLFLIDPRPFKALYDSALAEIVLRKANLAFQEAEFKRNSELVRTKAVSQSEFDKSAASLEQARAAVTAAEANSEAAKLNLEFTEIRAGVSGRISRAQIDVGNLVIADQTVLTTLVSVEPMQVLFDVDERRCLRIQKDVREGRLYLGEMNAVPVEMALDTDRNYPHRGVLDFIDNRLDAATGTIQLRGIFPNPAPQMGKRVLAPGMFARLRMPLGPPREAVMIAEQALGSDQGQKFVYVVDSQDEVQYRRVTTGKAEFGLRVIESGLKADERLIVGGLQRVRPGSKVLAKKVEMSSFAAAGWDEPPPGAAPAPTSTEPTSAAPAEKQPETETPDDAKSAAAVPTNPAPAVKP